MAYVTINVIDDVLKTVLSLYMEDEMLPLPTLSEVLICNSSTTTEEVCYVNGLDSSQRLPNLFTKIGEAKSCEAYL